MNMIRMIPSCPRTSTGLQAPSGGTAKMLRSGLFNEESNNLRNGMKYKLAGEERWRVMA
jgi:hypothetical protein